MSDEIKMAVQAIAEIKALAVAHNETVGELKAEVAKYGAERADTADKEAKQLAAMAVMQKSVDDAVLFTKRQSRIVTDQNGQEVDLDAKADKWAISVGRETGFEEKSFSNAAMQDYKKSFISLARKGFRSEMMTDVERKALSVGTDTAGGFFVDPDMSGRMVSRIFETSPIRAYASVQVIGTDTLVGYYDNDEVGFGWVSELEARPETSTPSVGKWSIPVHDMYAMPKASQQILDDASIDMEGWLSGKIGERFGRAENAAFVSGTGVGQPRGFLTYPTGTDLTNSVERTFTGVNGAFAAAPSGVDRIVTMMYGMKAPYRANATFFMNSTTTGALRNLKDSDGRPLWSDSVIAGQPATFLGKPVAIFEDMPNIATGSLSIGFGDLRSAYQIVDRSGIRMLRDPFTSKPSVLFYATKRTGGDMINGEALKLLEFSA